MTATERRLAKILKKCADGAYNKDAHKDVTYLMTWILHAQNTIGRINYDNLVAAGKVFGPR